MADLGPQIVTGAVAILGFASGWLADMARHRWQRQDRLHDELISIYGSYISKLRQSATQLSGLLSGTEPPDEVLARAREAEDLVGPVRLYANDEVQRFADELPVGRFYEQVTNLTNRGMNPQDAVRAAWGNHMQHPMECSRMR